jgi:hypothetical protein
MNMLTFVADTKERLLTVRLSPEDHRDYKIAAKLRGGTMSNLVHMFCIRVIREEKERNSEAFSKKRNEYERPVVKARLTRPKAKAKQSKG